MVGWAVIFFCIKRLLLKQDQSLRPYSLRQGPEHQAWYLWLTWESPLTCKKFLENQISIISEGHSPSVKRATAYRYGSTATIIAQIIEKENIFLLYGMSGRFGRSFFRKLKTYLLNIFICEIFVLEPFLLKISPFFPFFSSIFYIVFLA